MPAATVTVCLCTYRRPELLAALLHDLGRQSRLPDAVVVVDNDAAGSACSVIGQGRAALPFALHYAVEPEQNIALARNRALALAFAEARSDWLAFLDDDEQVGADWLLRLLATAAETRADGVLAPVFGVLPPEAPAWLHRGRFHAQRGRRPTGSAIPRESLCINNALIRSESLCAMPRLFDARYGLTGGEDTDLMNRLADTGVLLRWCDEAIATERVTPERQRLGWLLRRALRGGQDYAHFSRIGRYGCQQSPARIVLTAGLKLVIALLLALLLLPLGRHRGIAWLLKASANLGKISAMLGYRYREYASPPMGRGTQRENHRA